MVTVLRVHRCDRELNEAQLDKMTNPDFVSVSILCKSNNKAEGHLLALAGFAFHRSLGTPGTDSTNRWDQLPSAVSARLFHQSSPDEI